MLSAKITVDPVLILSPQSPMMLLKGQHGQESLTGPTLWISSLSFSIFMSFHHSGRVYLLSYRNSLQYRVAEASRRTR